MNPDPSAQRVLFTHPVDQTLRKLKVSNKLKPYLERNRIVELFSNLTREILTNKPKDVLKFVRNELVATRGNFVPQVILLGPPHVNVPALAEYVSRQMNIVHIKLDDIFTAHDDQRNRDTVSQYNEHSDHDNQRNRGTVSSVSKYNKHGDHDDQRNRGTVSQYNKHSNHDDQRNRGTVSSVSQYNKHSDHDDQRNVSSVSQYNKHSDHDDQRNVSSVSQYNKDSDHDDQRNVSSVSQYNNHSDHDDQPNKDTVSSVSQYNKHSDNDDQRNKSTVSQYNKHSDRMMHKNSTDPESKDMFNNDDEKVLDCKALAQTLLELFSRSNSNGWILTGFPRDDMDAQCLNRHKILPTHVVSLVSNDNQPTCSSTVMQNYKSTLFGIRRFYSHFLREINVCDRSVSKLGGIIAECVQVPLNKLYRPVTPRVVLFGPRGSGKRSLGQKLEENMHIIHFDMTQKLSNNTVGSQNKKCEELMVRLGEIDCLTLGYVLTGFPRNVDELRMLDQCENPPNRIIFLTLSDDICLKRHGERCFDMNTCREMRKEEVYDTRHSQCINMNRIIVTHPDDEIEQIKADLQAYRSVEQDMIKYTGKNAIFIDANTCSLNILYERVVSALKRPPLVSQDKTCEPATSSNVSQTNHNTILKRQQETNDNILKRQQDIPQCDPNKWKFTMKFKCSNNESKSCDLEQIKRILRDE